MRVWASIAAWIILISSSGAAAQDPLLARGDRYFSDIDTPLHFANKQRFSPLQIRLAMSERFNRYYTDPAWQPKRRLYVSQNGTSPVEENQLQSPSSIDLVLTHLQPGDLIHFLPGEYVNVNIRLSQSHSGTYDAPIVFYGARHADGSLAVSLKCAFDKGKSHTSACFNLEQTDYVAIDGFELNGGKYGIRAVGRYATTDHAIGVAILNNNGHHQCGDPFFTGESSWLVVENNKAHHGGDCPAGNLDGHGIYLSNGGDWVIVRYNELWLNHASDFQINSDPISTCAKDLDTDPECDGNAFAGQGKGISEFYWVEGNYFHNGLRQGPNFTGVRNSVVIGNVMAFMGTHGITFWQESNKTKPNGVNPDLGSRNNLIAYNLFLNDPKHSRLSGGRHVLRLQGFAVDNQIIGNLLIAGRIQNDEFTQDDSVILADIDADSRANHYSDNCAMGSTQFSEEFRGSWPRTSGRNYGGAVSAKWFAKFPWDKMGNIEDWNLTEHLPWGCPRLKFKPLPN